jgi:hypothetical protein
MKRLFSPCRRHHRNLSLLAAGALSDSEKDAVEKHLAACADCGKYSEEMKTVTVPLADWAGAFPRLQPSQTARRRWARAVAEAARPGPVRRFAPAAALQEWCHDVIWPWRRVWAGMAAVWLVILAGNVSLREPSLVITAKSATPTQEAINSFRDSQKILAELLADHSAPRDAARQKFFSPKPRTERYQVVAV